MNGAARKEERNYWAIQINFMIVLTVYSSPSLVCNDIILIMVRNNTNQRYTCSVNMNI